MFIIFGFGHQTRDEHFSNLYEYCNNCRNTARLKISKITYWFTLFFIPIIPYSTKYYLHCPICNYGIEIPPENYKEMLYSQIGVSLLRAVKYDQKSFICVKCEAILELDKKELENRYFICPECNTKNYI